MRCLDILAKRVRSQTVSLKFIWILLNKGYNMLNNTKIYDDIATYEVPVCALNNWRSTVVGVLAVVILERNQFQKQDMVHCEAFWHMDTTICNLSKIGSKIIAIRFCETWNRILKACIALKPEGDEKWKPRNSICYDQLCLTSTRYFWKMNRKWKFPNFQIYGFYDFFLFKSMNSTKNPQNSILCTLWHN